MSILKKRLTWLQQNMAPNTRLAQHDHNPRRRREATVLQMNSDNDNMG